MGDDKNNWVIARQRGRIISGIILILVGSLFFARKLGMEFPDWIFSWPMFFIALGFYVGGKHNFSNPSWLILVALGSILMIERFYPSIQIHEFFWPVVLIAIGAFLIVKPRKNKYARWINAKEMANCVSSETNENRIEILAVMGGVKKVVLSKDFIGGEINCVMGGAEINLTQADILGTAVLEINNVFGGTKLLVPANWEVQSEVAVVLGGVEDKRSQHANNSLELKRLILKGNCIFGGIDIKSY